MDVLLRCGRFSSSWLWFKGAIYSGAIVTGLSMRLGNRGLVSCFFILLFFGVTIPPSTSTGDKDMERLDKLEEQLSLSAPIFGKL